MTNLRDLSRAVQRAEFPSAEFAAAVREALAEITKRLESARPEPAQKVCRTCKQLGWSGCEHGEPEPAQPEPASPDKKSAGLYSKFKVERTDGKSAPGEKHHDCEYFVLDLTHDKFAQPALRAYAHACAAEYPKLSADLRGKFTVPAAPVEMPEGSNRSYTAENIREWIRARGYLDIDQHNRFGWKLPTSNMGRCMEALADALDEIEALRDHSRTVGVTEELDEVLGAAWLWSCEPPADQEKIRTAVAAVRSQYGARL